MGYNKIMKKHTISKWSEHYVWSGYEKAYTKVLPYNAGYTTDWFYNNN